MADVAEDVDMDAPQEREDPAVNGGDGPAEPLAEADEPQPAIKASKTKKATPSGLSLNYDRSEKICRTTWWAFIAVVRPWVLGACRSWCGQHHAESAWYKREKTAPLPDDAKAELIADDEWRHLVLLCKHVPGFRTFWLELETDLRLMVEPFWEWEKGNFKPLFEHCIEIAALFAFYERPHLTKTAVFTVWLLLHYSDLQHGRGRPDLLVLIAANCWALNERIVELHHARQSLGMKWTRDVSLEDFKRLSCLTPFRSEALAKEAETETSSAKQATPRIKQLHERIIRGKKNEETRAVTINFLKDAFVKAAKGEYKQWEKQPVRVNVGLARLLDENVLDHPCSIAAVERWISGSAVDFDVLIRKNSLAALQALCDQQQIEWRKVPGSKLTKRQLCQMLRASGYEEPDSDSDKEDE